MDDREVLDSGIEVNRFAAFPTYVNGLSGTGASHFVGFSLGGRRALIPSYGSDELVLYDATTHSPATQRHFPLSGSNPTGIVTTPDGRKGYVSYDDSIYVSVLDLSAYAQRGKLPRPLIVPYEYRDAKLLPVASPGVSAFELVRHIKDLPDRPELRETAKVTLVDVDPVDPVLRRGKTLFYSANPEKYPTLSKSSLGACASCHPDGGSDGSVWVTMEGERRTMSLRGGVEGRGWLHASGTHKDIDDFLSSVIPERMGGLLSDADRHALAEYVARGIPALQGPPTDKDRVARGQVLFSKSCSSCHAGPKRTNGGADPANRWGGGGESGPVLNDLGTATTDAHAELGTYFESIVPPKDAQVLHAVRGDRALGPGDALQTLLDFRPRPARARGRFKATSLINAWDSPLFFHDGHFDKLADAVHFMNESLHLKLSCDDEGDLVEFLKTL
ncbi:MAG: hypothetical protein NVSMB1_16350 [Polyangiales bacterium]